MDTAKFKIYLLGQPKIRWGDDPIQITRLATRTLLFYLASNTYPVGRSKLCELFWPQLLEKDARTNLRGLLSKLKHALPEPELLETRDDLVCLNRASIYIDLHAYNHQLEDLKEIPWRYPEDVPLPDIILNSLQSLVSLWQGDHFLQDTRLVSSHGIDDWLTMTNGWLNTSRTMCLNRLAAHFSLCGDMMMAVKYYRDILAYDENNLTIYKNIIQCLIRSGHINAAQSALDFSIAQLNNSSGEILPEELMQAKELLNSMDYTQSQTLRPAYSQELGMQLNMVGRQKALMAIQTTFNTGGVLSISGESGVGKSRLVKEFYERYWPSVRLLLIRCTETGQNSPLQAIVDMLKKSIKEEEWKALPNLWANFLTILIPELTLLKPDLVIPAHPTGNLGEGLIFEALVNLFTLVGQKERLLFVLDDAQWADVSTLSVIHHLVSSGFIKKNGALLIVYQNEESNSKLHNTLVSLRRSDNINSLHLDSLTLDDTRALISQMLVNAPDEAFVTNFYHSTGGNPYIILETMKEIMAHTPSEKDLKFNHPLPISKSVQLVVSNKLDRLDSHSLLCLQAAAILGRTFERDVLTLMVDQPSALLSGSLHELSFFGLIKPEGKTPTYNLLRFSYTMDQRTIISNLSTAIKIQLHNRAAQALEIVYRDQVSAQAARIATHYQMGENYPEALRWWLEAEKYAFKIYSKEAALHAFSEVESILMQNPSLISDEEACDFFSHKTAFAYESNDIPMLNLVCQDCLELGKKRSSPLLLGNAHLSFNYLHFSKNEYNDALNSLEKAITYLSVTSRKLLLAEAYIRKGIILAYLQHFNEAITAYDQAETLSKDIQDPSVLELVYQAKAHKSFSYFNIGQIRKAFAEIDNAYTRYEDILRPFNHIRGHLAYCYCLLDMAQYDQALDHVRKGIEFSKSLGNITFEIYFNLILSKIEIRKGNLDGASAMIEELITQSEFIRHPDLFMRANGILAELFMILQDYSEAEILCKIATKSQLRTVQYFSIINDLAYCLVSQRRFEESESIIKDASEGSQGNELGTIIDETIINQAYIDLQEGNADKTYHAISEMIKKSINCGRIEKSILLKTLLMKAAGKCGYFEEVDALQSELSSWSQENASPWVYLSSVPIWLQYTHQGKERKNEMITRSRELLAQLEPLAQSDKIKASFIAAKEYWSNF